MNPNIKRHLLRLFNGDMSQEEFLEWYGIRLRFTDIGSIPGFTYLEGGRKYIVININLTLEAQRRVFFHELDHVLRVPESCYVVSIDKIDSYWELAAEEFAEEASKEFKKVKLRKRKSIRQC